MSRAIEALLAVSRKSSRTVVGMISGTSADSIDVAVCRIVGDPEQVELVYYAEQPLDPGIQASVRSAVHLGVRELSDLHVRVGERFAEACLATLARAGHSPHDIDLVGSHGQTVYHHSSIPGAIRSTLQVGDGDVIAERTGLPVLCDFRARDIAAGGEGAPVTPRADTGLFAGGGPAGARAGRALTLGG